MLRHYKNKVKKILEKYPNARNNDHTLLACYIYEYQKEIVKRDDNNEPYIYLRDFKRMPPSQTLVNNRKVIQNKEGELLPTDSKVIKSRRIKSKKIKQEWREYVK